MIKGKKIIVAISGGIAAYKIPDFIRLLIRGGAEVQVVATQNALRFVTPLTLETVSKRKLYSDTFGTVNEYQTEHIALADWADCMIVAPATANIIGKMANGIADDALSTAFLAFNKPVVVAPAMNTNMYGHPAVQQNIKRLESYGVSILEPAIGELACGIVAKGRMPEPIELFSYLDNFLEEKPLLGKRVLITAGPTYEKIDPVRFIGNYSSGKMGFALAEICAKKGALVTLVAGPVQLKTPHSCIERINVESAAEMYAATEKRFAEQDIAIMCAAVADFTPHRTETQKVKRKKDDLTITLKPTQDIAATLGAKKKGRAAAYWFCAGD